MFTRNLTAWLAGLVLVVGCGQKGQTGTGGEGDGSSSATPARSKTPLISVDGSSTVYPITEAVVEAFDKAQGAGDEESGAGSKVRVTVGVSGTGGGFKKLCGGEIAVMGASRPIKSSEVELCATSGVDYVELPVAYDGIAVVVNPSNDWVDSMTVEELKTLWAPRETGAALHWSDVRPGWPQREVHLFGPGIDSGTYDYFTKVIVGEEPASPADFTSSEDDNVLVAGVASDPHALAFFGFAYQNENRSKLRLVPIDDGRPGNGAGPIAPTAETVGNGTYQPLSRPIFIYAALSGQTRPEVDRFVEFFLREGPALAKELGYTPLSPLAAEAVQKRWQARSTGSLYRGAEDRSGTRVEDLLVREATQDAAAATL